MNLEEVIPAPVTCRQSSIACAYACRRKWWCKYRMRITLRGIQAKPAATLGKIYHRLQQLGPDRREEVRAEVRKEQAALMMRVDRGEDLDGQIARLATMLTALYHKAEVMALLFWEKYPPNPHFVELGKEITHRVTRNSLVIEGTIDKLLINTTDDQVWIRDHKSTGENLETIFGGLPWSLQGRIYRILANDYLQAVLQERKARGFILDGILTPGIKLCRTDRANAKSWNCTPEEAYLRRVKDWYKEHGMQAIRSVGGLFTEPEVTSELEEAFELMRKLSIIDPSRPELYSRDITRRECFAYHKQCIYHDLCSTDPNQWDGLFETKYRFEEVKQ